MTTVPALRDRAFKTSWFAKAARKAGVTDADLCKAIRQVRLGQCDDLGGGVFKKRVSNNLYRSIILAKGGKHWIFAFLYAKKDRANITAEELDGFRDLAKQYAKLTTAQIARLLKDDDFTEICHDSAQV